MCTLSFLDVVCVTSALRVMLYFNNNPFIPLNYYFPFMYKCRPMFVLNAFILVRRVVCSHFLIFSCRPLQSEDCPAGERVLVRRTAITAPIYMLMSSQTE